MDLICRLAGLITAAVVVVPPDAGAQSPILQMLSKNWQVELVAKGGQFLEGPLFDREGTLWLVEVLGGWLSRVDGDKVVRVVQATPDFAASRHRPAQGRAHLHHRPAPGCVDLRAEDQEG